MKTVAYIISNFLLIIHSTTHMWTLYIYGAVSVLGEKEILTSVFSETEFILLLTVDYTDISILSI